MTSFGTGGGRGGAIAADSGGALTLTRAIVSDGRAFVGGGLYLAAAGSEPGKLKISRSTFISNHATGLGGGLDVVGDVTSKISKSLFYENTVQNPSSSSDGGGISNRGTNDDHHRLDFRVERSHGRSKRRGHRRRDPQLECRTRLVVRRSLFEFNSASAPTAGSGEDGGAIWTASGSDTVYDHELDVLRQQRRRHLTATALSIYVNAGTVILANATFNENGTFTAAARRRRVPARPQLDPSGPRSVWRERRASSTRAATTSRA